MIAQDYTKMKIALRYWLLGKGYLEAVRALDHAEGIHVNFRRDGVTPEFTHQISITNFLRTYGDLLPPEDVEPLLVASLLHDGPEDYGTDVSSYSARSQEIVSAVTKWSSFNSKDKEDYATYYDTIAMDPLAVIVKAGDRINNQQSMIGVFKVSRQITYMKEVDDFLLPTIKRARKVYPRYEPIMENLKFILQSQCDIIRHYHSINPDAKKDEINHD